MNARFLLAVIVSSLAGFFGGWLLFGLALPEYYASNANPASKVLERPEPFLWAIGLGNVAWALLLTWILHRTGGTTFGKAFATSAGISLLVMIVFNFSMYGFWDIYPLGFVLTDVLIGTVFWALVGAVAGLVLGSGRRSH